MKQGNGRRLIVYGATGNTGVRLAELAAAAGLNPVLSGRNESQLRQLADRLGLEVRVSDLSAAQLDAAFADAAVVVSCVGPYSRFGQPVVEAAIRNRAHYVDFTGEPRYVQRLIDEFDVLAREANVVLIPSAGAGAATNLIALATADGVGEVKKIRVCYDIRDMQASTGTLQSVFSIQKGGAPVLRRGVLSFVAAGSGLSIIDGKLAVIMPFTDPLTLSRLWPQATIDVYRIVKRPLLFRFMMPLRMKLLALRWFRTKFEQAELKTRGAATGEAHGYFKINIRVEGDKATRIGIADIENVYDETPRCGLLVAKALLEHPHSPGVRAAGEVLGDPYACATEAGIRLHATEVDRG